MIDKDASLGLWAEALRHIELDQPDVLEWARSVGDQTFTNLRGKQFLRSYCFVVYASGFKFATVKAKFDDLAASYHGFDIERLRGMHSVKPVLKVFGNERKARNFLDGARKIGDEGFAQFKRRLKAGGPDILMELPGIGPITKDHLAKNIGLADVAKADVWLVRAAELCGSSDVNELVEFLHAETGETKHVIDVAIWTLGKDGLFPSTELTITIERDVPAT